MDKSEGSKRDAGIGAAGRDLGVAITHYLVWVGETAAAEGAERVHFLSREGAWLAGHFSWLRRNRPGTDHWPEAVALAVSRRSTFLPSLVALTPEAVQPLIAQYRDATVGAVLDSLGLPPDTVDVMTAVRAWRDDVAVEVLARPEVLSPLSQRHAEQRDALCRYLSQVGIASRSTVYVADIGWRGTIQDNLARVLPDCVVKGLYFNLQPFFVEQAENVRKAGFTGDSRTAGRRIRFAAPFEFAASGPTASVTGYRVTDGVAEPVYDTLVPVPHDASGFADLQAGIACGLSTARRIKAPSAATALYHALRFVERPPRSLALVYFKAWRDDRFGAGVLRTAAPRLPPALVLRAILSAGARQNVGLQLAESGWPWALLARDLPWAASILRCLILGTDARL